MIIAGKHTHIIRGHGKSHDIFTSVHGLGKGKSD